MKQSCSLKYKEQNHEIINVTLYDLAYSQMHHNFMHNCF
jgi:hypothetical protein